VRLPMAGDARRFVATVPSGTTSCESSSLGNPRIPDELPGLQKQFTDCAVCILSIL
jgi:hypothetical protein